MESFLLNHIEALGNFIYLIIFIGLLLEGEAVLFVSAFLAHQGYIKLEYVIPVAILAIFTVDISWFKFGTVFGGKFPSIKRRLDKYAAPIDGSLKTRPYHTIFVSKFAYGLTRITIMRCGAKNIPIAKFFKADIPATVLWLVVILSLGSVSSAAATAAKHYLKYAEVGILLGLATIFVISKLVAKNEFANTAQH